MLSSEPGERQLPDDTVVKATGLRKKYGLTKAIDGINLTAVRALLAVGCGLLVLAALSLAFALRRSGTDALGWPEQPKPFSQEPV